MPEWRRYETQSDAPYVKGRWYDPFNRNKLKGDYPIFGQRWFLECDWTEPDRLWTRDGCRYQAEWTVRNRAAADFLARGEQAFASETLRFSLDLFRGDTSFRPADLRFRFTPEVNLNFLQARERGIVNIDPRKGSDRFDAHVGVQEAFVEAKLRDLSPNYDFVSIRAGIQQFTQRFSRVSIFRRTAGHSYLWESALEPDRLQPGVVLLLEKNTNSGLNTFQKRDQQVYVANVYVQDFLAKGYTTEFSFHYNRDDGGVHFDDNGFLVRPAPLGQS